MALSTLHPLFVESAFCEENKPLQSNGTMERLGLVRVQIASIFQLVLSFPFLRFFILFIRSFVRSFVHSFIHSVSHSFIHSFAYLSSVLSSFEIPSFLFLLFVKFYFLRIHFGVLSFFVDTSLLDATWMIWKKNSFDNNLKQP